jgi:uncharacterized protein YraI
MATFSLRSLRIALAVAVLPAVAMAQPSVINSSANLRAGPGPNYPVVAQLRPGVPVDVAGCTAGYHWCDVVLSGNGLRGWVFARSLSSPYQGQRVPLANFGANIGVPLISFSIGNYWGSHYRDRPFYREPRYWGGRPPPPQFYGRPEHRPEWRGDEGHRHGRAEGWRGDREHRTDERFRGGDHGGGHRGGNRGDHMGERHDGHQDRGRGHEREH